MRLRCNPTKSNTENRKVNRAESHGIKKYTLFFQLFSPQPSAFAKKATARQGGKGMENPSDTLCVKDLYEGAYLLCMGFQLKKLTIVDAQRKRKAVFVISGAGIEEKAESYRMGQATVNVAMLKFTLEKLKDAMFAKIREQEGAGHRC
jgi:hypothetical protein